MISPSYLLKLFENVQIFNTRTCRAFAFRYLYSAPFSFHCWGFLKACAFSVHGESDPESLALASAGRLHQLFCSSLWLNLVKLPFFTLAEWFLPWLQHPLLPNGLYLSSYFTERQMREPIDPATLSCY